MMAMVTQLLAIMVVVSGEIQRYLVFILVLLVEQLDISRFCSQIQSLADHGPNNNILYPQGPPFLVNRDSHEQSMQALTHSHHVDKRAKPYNQPSAKPNRMGNRFGAYPEITSHEDISTEEFTHKTPGRLPMTAGWAQQEQCKWSWSRRRADETYQCDSGELPHCPRYTGDLPAT